MATTAEQDVSLTKAVEQAVKTRELESQDKSSVQVPEKQSEQEETEQQEEEEKEQETPQGDWDEEATQGKTLIQALKDPTKAPLVVDFLARQLGYTKGENKTQTEVKKDIQEVIAEHLGEEFKFLAPKLTPAIKEAVKQILDERGDTSADLRERVNKAELRELESEAARTHVELAQEWFGSNDMPANVIQAMSQAMDDLPPTNPNMAAATYYR